MATTGKRVLAGAVAVALLGVGLVGGNAWATHRFSDIPDGSWAAQQADWLVDNGLAAGYPDGTFRPGDPVTRAQVGNWLRNYDANQTGGVAVVTIESDTPVFFDDRDALTACAPEDTGTQGCVHAIPTGIDLKLKVFFDPVAWGDGASACPTGTACSIAIDGDKTITVSSVR